MEPDFESLEPHDRVTRMCAHLKFLLAELPMRDRKLVLPSHRRQTQGSRWKGYSDNYDGPYRTKWTYNARLV